MAVNGEAFACLPSAGIENSIISGNWLQAISNGSINADNDVVSFIDFSFISVCLIFITKIVKKAEKLLYVGHNCM